jgi:hypothetical protein
MPTLISNASFKDIYDNPFNIYTANAGDRVRCEINFSNCCCITSSLMQQITYSQLTGEVKLYTGSWIDEGFRVGDVVTFEGFNEVNSGTGIYYLTILSIPTDLIMVVSGLPANNNYSPPAGHTWQFWVNKQKEELQLNVNWTDNFNTSTTPTMNSLIDGESQRLILEAMNTLVITNGASSTPLVQVGKKSGSFEIETPLICRNDDDTYGGATRYNYTIAFWVNDFGFLFPDRYVGSECLKFVSKLALKTEASDTQTSDVYYSTSANTGLFNEGYNNNISLITLQPVQLSVLSFNKITSIPFSITVDSTTIDKFEIGACYSTFDDHFNLNIFPSQNAPLKLLKTGLIDASDIGTVYSSDCLLNEYYNITLTDLTVTTGTQTNFSGSIEINPRYIVSDGFGKFIETRGDTDRLFYLWVKLANTNCLLFGGNLTFEYPVGIVIEPQFERIINHDDNDNHSDMSEVIMDANDLNIEDDLACILDFELFETDINQSVEISIVCVQNYTGNEFPLEKMVYDISTQDLNFWNNTTQNVNNNLPTASAKKQSYLFLKSPLDLGSLSLRLYYPFLIRWQYWITQLNATAPWISSNKNNQNWINYTSIAGFGSLKIKLGIVRNGVMDYYYKLLRPLTYDSAKRVISTIELIDMETFSSSDSIIKGREYTVKATHIKTQGIWSDYPYGQITIESFESQPRFVISTEVNADVIPDNPLTGNEYLRLNESRPNPETIIYECNLKSLNLFDNNYSFTSKVSDEGVNNNPVFEKKIMENNTEKITEDLETKITE